MSRRPLRHPLASAVLVLVLAWTTQAPAAPITFTASGANAAGIQSSVDAFRAAMGNPDNTNAGPQAGGHRDINWDGGGATNGTAAATPFIVFQNTRGATFTTPGSGLRQTPIVGGTVDIAPLVGGLQGSLSALNATYATTFSTFSPNRLFVPLDSTITDGFFSVPGTGGTAPATVAGFGVVFSDIDLANSTSLQFFDAQGNPIGNPFFAPIGTVPDGSLSFLGVIFTTERIARVRIISGNTALGA